ncbi:MAG: hypothetical protein QN229_05805 [Desulfurococcaceae archaeon TW002]
MSSLHDGEEVKECSRIINVLVVRASDVAKLLSKPPEGDEVSVKFGKIFEEEYALANHIYERAWYVSVSKWFVRKVAARLRAEGIYRRDLVLKAYRAYAALINAGVIGEKPGTVFRNLTDDLFIAAQPDLYNESTKTYYEFKLYPINDYARKQAEVFAWVLEKPVVLVGLKEDLEGYVSVEKEVVVPPKDLRIDVSELKKVAVVEEFCADLMIPTYQYERSYARYFWYGDYDVYED